MITLLALSFLAGLVSIISPCVLPMVPVVFAGAQGDWRRGVSIVMGMVVFFVLMGFLVSLVGKLWIFRAVAYAGLAAFGVVMVSDSLYSRYSVFSSRIVGSIRLPADSFLFGALLGLVWTPCIGPIVGALLSYNAISSTSVEGAVSMLFFGFGIATGIGLILRYGEKRRIFAEYGERLRRVSGWIILIFVFLLVTGIYTQIEIMLSRLVPV
ncbi:Cytochrome C biogenesis protein transmembrane region [Geoglobus ahangari]|uniref:Cytochrome C biogenesis protein transmembrane region n=1 Tax=Geoglobus ahangari TaxID=113653 RepID=A0A0F7IDT1_9EURY|nr:cytochrome c biogenesis protein CcdA [Geoglobus ahangari]AKG91645.1 Cytochrome C biogenesis protein transmembrane region [Geoglobus ahangari]